MLHSMSDFIGSLALFGVLILAFSIIGRRFADAVTFDWGLGLLFGLVAVYQMNVPFTPTPGLIIDMRNVPIVLAGAFLGWRGLLTALILAATARMVIGGVGTTAGVWGMLIAGGVGLWWSGKGKTSVQACLLLGLAANLHLLSALALPRQLAVWFYTEAAPWIMVMNICLIPPLAALLVAEIRTREERDRMSRAVLVDPKHGMMSVGAFREDIARASVACEPGAVAGVICVILERDVWYRDTVGEAATQTILSQFGQRLRTALVHGDRLGCDGRTRLVCAVTVDETLRRDALKADIEMLLTREPVLLGPDMPIRPRVSVLIQTAASSGDLASAIDRVMYARPRRWSYPFLQGHPRVAERGGVVETMARKPEEPGLFQKANLLIDVTHRR